MEKGFKTLELIGELNDKYIEEASRPWENKKNISRIAKRWRVAVAGVLLLTIIGCTLEYHEEVKAALQKVTSWIGQALGIENGDVDSYIDVAGKSITKNEITITLNEVAMDDRHLWIAYSDGNSDNKESGSQKETDDTILFTQVQVNGQEIKQGAGVRDVGDSTGNSGLVEDFIIGEDIDTEKAINIEFKVWPGTLEDADTWEKVQKLQAETEPYVFKFSASKEELEKNTIDLKLNQEVVFDSHSLKLTEFRWNPFDSTIYGTYNENIYVDSSYYLIGTDDHGNKICYKESGRNGTETTFQLDIDPEFGGYTEISPEAKSLTLQLYVIKDDPEHQVYEESVDKDLSDGVYEESAGYVYEEGESPADAGVPVGEKFTIQIR